MLKEDEELLGSIVNGCYVTKSEHEYRFYANGMMLMKTFTINLNEQLIKDLISIWEKYK